MKEKSNFNKDQQVKKIETAQEAEKIKLDMLYNMFQGSSAAGKKKNSISFADVGRR